MRISDWSSDVCSSDLQTSEERLLLDFFAGVRCQIANDIVSGGTVAIIDREAGRIQRYANPAPRPVERFGNSQLGLFVVGCGDLGLVGLLFSLRDHGLRLLLAGAQKYHQARQHGRIQALVFLAIHPFGRTAVAADLFDHMLMTDIDFGLAVDPRHARAKAIALAAVDRKSTRLNSSH